MSAQEFDQLDEELMGLVNGHATPAAVEAAEEIVEQVTTSEQSLKAEQKEPTKFLGETEEGYHISKKQFDELEAKMEKTLRHKTIAAVVVCVMMAMVLLMVMAKPSLLIWLVNIGVVICSVITGIAVDRWCRR